jgi:hypothetical protein
LAIFDPQLSPVFEYIIEVKMVDENPGRDIYALARGRVLLEKTVNGKMDRPRANEHRLGSEISRK